MKGGTGSSDTHAYLIKNLARMGLSVLLCVTVGGLGGMITATSVSTWYPTLNKPFWTPSSGIFGPAWTVLYILMGLSLWRVWSWASRKPVRPAIILFGAQLALNLAWSLLFFGLRSPGAAFMDIVLLWIAILATTVAFWRVERTAGILLIPYLLWVTYALALNFALWRMN